MFNIGSQELLIIFFVVLLLFGAKRVPEVAHSFGAGIRDLKKAMAGIEDELKIELDDRPRPRPDSAKALAPPTAAVPSGTAVAPAPPQSVAGGAAPSPAPPVTATRTEPARANAASAASGAQRGWIGPRPSGAAPHATSAGDSRPAADPDSGGESAGSADEGPVSPDRPSEAS